MRRHPDAARIRGRNERTVRTVPSTLTLSTQLPVVLGQAVQRPELLDADVGAQDVASAQREADVLAGSLDAPRVADVDPRRRRGDVEFLGQRRGPLLGRRLVDVEQRYGHPLPSEDRAQGGSESATTARDDSDLSLQLRRHAYSSPFHDDRLHTARTS